MFDIKKYTGVWHEIFKIPFEWDPGCNAVTAEYQVIGENKLSVKNTCYFSAQDFYSRTGIVVEDNQEYKNNDQVEKRLIVEFTDGLPAGPPGPYWIHWTDYQFSVVGGPTRDQLWLLARKPEIDAGILQDFVTYVSTLGYNIDRVRLSNNVTVVSTE